MTKDVRLESYVFLRITVLLIIIILSVLITRKDCIKLKFVKMGRLINTERIKNSCEIIILYNICANCRVGEYLRKNHMKKIVYIVPGNFSDNDIENLIDVYSIKGFVIKGDKNTEKLLKRISVCLGLKTWEENIIIGFNKSGRISSLLRI